MLCVVCCVVVCVYVLCCVCMYCVCRILCFDVCVCVVVAAYGVFALPSRCYSSLTQCFEPCQPYTC